MSSEVVARFISGTDLEETELHPLGKGLAAMYTTRCPDKKTVNEDSIAIIPWDDHSGVLIVADGCGGLPQGQVASETALAAIKKSLKKGIKEGSSLRSAIMDGIEEANRAVTALPSSSATTLAIAEIQKDKIRTYHVGDSQIMLISQRGKVKFQTVSHSPVGYALEAGMIDENEAMVHEERHLVSNLVGDPNMRIEVGTEMQIAAKDTIVIGSDGLFDNLHTSEIIEYCRKGQLLACSRNLIDACTKRMNAPSEGDPSKPDDLSFIAFRRRISA